MMNRNDLLVYCITDENFKFFKKFRNKVNSLEKIDNFFFY